MLDTHGTLHYTTLHYTALHCLHYTACTTPSYADPNQSRAVFWIHCSYAQSSTY